MYVSRPIVHSNHLRNLCIRQIPTCSTVGFTSLLLFLQGGVQRSGKFAAPMVTQINAGMRKTSDRCDTPYRP